MVHDIFLASNPNSSPTAIDRLCLAMNIANAISADVTLSISQPAATNGIDAAQTGLSLCDVCCPLYVTLHIVSSAVADTKMRIACYTVGTYAFAALWLLARILGNVLAHSLLNIQPPPLNFRCFFAPYLHSSPVNRFAMFTMQFSPTICTYATLSCAKIANWEDNQLSGKRLVLRAEHRVV